MKYWAYINNEILGPYEKEELIKLPQFTNSTLLCPQSPVGEKTEDWKEAASFPEISALISNTSARSMSANPTDSGFNNPFHNFGNIEIKSIDAAISSQAEPQPQAQSPLDPISLSQIARRQENFFKKEENNEVPNEKNQAQDPQKVPETPEETAKENNETLLPKIDLPEITPLSAGADASNPSGAPPADTGDQGLPGLDTAKNELPDIAPSIDLKPLPEITPLSSGPDLSGGVSPADGNNADPLKSEAAPFDSALPETAPLSAGADPLKDASSSADSALPDLSNLSLPDSLSLPPEMNSQTQPEIQEPAGKSPVSDDMSAEKSFDLPSSDLSQQSSQELSGSVSSGANVKQDISADFSQLKEAGKKIDEINRETEKILALIEKFASNSAGKDDLSSLRTYLDSKIEILGNRINSFDTAEINSSLKNIENKILSIEKKLDSGAAIPKTPPMSAPAIQIEKNYDSAVMSGEEVPRSEKPQAPAAPAPAVQNKKDEPQQSAAPAEKKKIDLGPVFKTVLKAVLSIILAAGIGIAMSLALRSAGIIDLTVYMPFVPPAKKAKNEGGSKNITPPPVSQPSQGVEVSTASASSASKDLSDEAVYFVRTYIKEGTDKTIENLVIEHAQKSSLDSKAITWRAQKMTEDNYNVFAEFPGGKMPVYYLFEVDYKNKKIRPSNDLAGYIIEADEGTAPPKQSLDKKTVVVNEPQKKAENPQSGKVSPKKAKTKTKNIHGENKQAVKPAQEKKAEEKKPETKPESKPKESDEEEYVYEYEDEGEQEYLMPGIPKK